jgi:Tfp pilus assembly protein PilO
VSSMSDRDRKILIGLVPLIVIVAYWFLLLAPKREEATKAQKDLTEQQQRLAAAKEVSTRAKGARTSFAADYGEIVRLGKAIPARVDMPSLLVQLDRAAEGTDIRFTKIVQGDRLAVPAATPPATTTPPADGSTPPADGSTPPATGTTPPATPPAPGTAPPVAAGGAPAASAPGTATEAANTAAATSDQRNDAANQSGVSPTDAQTSTSTGGGLPVGGAAGTPAADGSAAPVSGGLETVPLELEFVGNFFHLADFFHDVKRFVHVANTNVLVNGRLITIEGVNFSSDTTIFPRIKAELTATVYLSPLAQGATAGATPAGPATAPTTPAATPAPATPPAGGSTPPAPAPAPTPTAAATPR